MPSSLTPIRRELQPAASLPPAIENAPAHTIDFRSSDATLDRYQEIITVAGWHLDTYRKNPVFQNAHCYGSLADTIGKSLITEIRGDHLYQRVQFAVEENPLARVAYNLYKGGFLNTVSVGFIPLRWEDGTQHTPFRRKYVEQELIEVSAVSIPANPNAVSLALRAGAIELTDLREAIDMLQAICTQAHRPDAETATLQCATAQARVLQLQKQMKEILQYLAHSPNAKK
jgi:HK97 family phage prohead protease